MDEEAFRLYLRRKGKKPSVVDRNVKSVKEFQNFLQQTRTNDLSTVSTSDIKSYVETIEEERNTSAKGALYVLMNYFRFLGNSDLLTYTGQLREKRTKKSRRVFPLKEFYQVNLGHVNKLASIGIKNVEEMLEAGKTIKQRRNLAKQLDIPEEGILRLVELSDITRIGYVKSKLATLYHSAGIDTPTKIAKFTAEDLYGLFKEYVEKNNWDGMVPNPADLENNIKSAKKLKEVVEK